MFITLGPTSRVERVRAPSVTDRLVTQCYNSANPYAVNVFQLVSSRTSGDANSFLRRGQIAPACSCLAPLRHVVSKWQAIRPVSLGEEMIGGLVQPTLPVQDCLHGFQ